MCFTYLLHDLISSIKKKLTDAFTIYKQGKSQTISQNSQKIKNKNLQYKPNPIWIQFRSVMTVVDLKEKTDHKRSWSTQLSSEMLKMQCYFCLHYKLCSETFHNATDELHDLHSGACIEYVSWNLSKSKLAFCQALTFIQKQNNKREKINVMQDSKPPRYAFTPESLPDSDVQCRSKGPLSFS